MKVFEESRIAGLSLKNRIIRSATHEGMAGSDGIPLETPIKDLYLRLANGATGMIITGYAGILNNGKSYGNMKLLSDDSLIPLYQRIIAPVKETGTPILLQIAHAGGMVSSDVNVSPGAPSSLNYRISRNTSHELSVTEIETIISGFTSAILRAKKSGFDGVQLHAAHGYLLSAFLSPFLNRRTDRWGGSLENRFRIIHEILSRARQEVGDFPILAKLSAYDDRRNGMTVDESARIAKMLEDSGCDALEISCGNDNFFQTVRSPSVPVDALIHFTPGMESSRGIKRRVISAVLRITFGHENETTDYNVAAAAAIKKAVAIPVITVGGIRSLDSAKKVIETGQADYVAMSRPFILEPDLVRKWESGERDDARCNSCSYCMFGIGYKPLRCYYGMLPKDSEGYSKERRDENQ